MMIRNLWVAVLSEHVNPPTPERPWATGVTELRQIKTGLTNGDFVMF